ncbi:MAG: class I SAM-dependent methyltransferase [Pseudomonadota bacterium]
MKSQTCRICNSNANKIFDAKIMNKYIIDYFHCSNCGFLQTEAPYWLEESYKHPINPEDTGVLHRNVRLSKITSLLLFFLFKKSDKFLDFAGGYGIFTRLMRDRGLDFYWYDPYTQNLVARGFEYDDNSGPVSLITSFELFEHLSNPTKKIEQMLKCTSNILFTTFLLPKKLPKPKEWWYYGLSHVQHISFYSRRTLRYLANKFDLELYSNGRNIHFLTEKKIGNMLFNLIVLSGYMNLDFVTKIRFKGKTTFDREYLINKRR